MELIPTYAALEQELLSIDFLSALDKMHILLLVVGEKPACTIGLLSPKDWSPAEDEAFDQRIKRGQTLLEQCALAYTYGLSLTDDARYSWASLQVGKDVTSLLRLQVAQRMRRGERSIAIGRALGYPDTAAEAFASRQCFMRPEYYPDEIRGSDTVQFASFAFSQAHWQEELAFVRQIQQRVKVCAPLLYQEIISVPNS